MRRLNCETLEEWEGAFAGAVAGARVESLLFGDQADPAVLARAMLIIDEASGDPAVQAALKEEGEWPSPELMRCAVLMALRRALGIA